MSIRQHSVKPVRHLLAGALAAVVLFPSLGFAQAQFGAEFNFSNPTIRNAQTAGHIVNSDESEAGRDAMKAQVLKVCGDCRVRTEENAYGVVTYKIIYPDGWYFVISTDPAVVEIQAKPSTVAEIEAMQERMQRDIFDSAAAVGLLPSTKSMGKSWAGSHIHVGLTSALGTEPVQAVHLLSDFMVDFSNHSELAEGVFTDDLLNAPPLYKLPKKETENFKVILESVKSGQIKNVNEFANRVRAEVYDKTLSDTQPTTKYQAFNVNRIGDEHFKLSAQTFELRAMRGQESALDFLIETQLIEARLKYLKGRPERMPLNLAKGRFNDAQVVENFYRYVTETGLSFQPYEKFLSPSQNFLLPGIRDRIEREKLAEPKVEAKVDVAEPVAEPVAAPAARPQPTPKPGLWGRVCPLIFGARN